MVRNAMRCDLAAVKSKGYDLIVLGGGIYGAMFALEAGLRGLKALLIEKDDFGGSTSANNLRILHGGFRYLQRMDLPRFFESVHERWWYLQKYPELVRPLPCIMPLTGRGIYRAPVFKCALELNDLLSRRRNDGVRPDQRLPGGRIVRGRELGPLHTLLDRDVPEAALWYDAIMRSPQRILIEILRWSAELGIDVCNYARVVALRSKNGSLRRVVVEDDVTGEVVVLRTSVLINATGPHCRSTLEQLGVGGRPSSGLTLAWNLVVDRLETGRVAVGATSPRDGNTYFLVPWREQTMIGTAHDACAPGQSSPSESQLADKLDSINAAFPGINLSVDGVLRVMAGRLPGQLRNGTVQLARRPEVINHAGSDGPQGLITVSGIKFTTARSVAGAVLAKQFGKGFLPSLPRCAQPRVNPFWDVVALVKAGLGEREGLEALRVMAAEEAVVEPEDLLLRRTSLGEWPNDEVCRRLSRRFRDEFPGSLASERSAAR